MVGGDETDRVYVDVASSNGAIWVEGNNNQNVVTLRGIAPIGMYQQVLLTTKSVIQLSCLEITIYLEPVVIGTNPVIPSQILVQDTLSSYLTTAILLVLTPLPFR